MTTLVLPPRYTSDSITLSRAASRKGWEVCRFTSWRVPEGFDAEKVVLYGEGRWGVIIWYCAETILPGPDSMVYCPASAEGRSHWRCLFLMTLG